MSDRKDGPGLADVADEHGRFSTEEGLPGEPAMIPDTEADASAHRPEADRTGSGPRLGTQGAAIADLSDPDANAPRPSRSSSMAMAGGGYGDSRDVGDRGPAAIRDEGKPAGEAGIASGSHINDDGTKGEPPGAGTPAENPPVEQPANVRRP